MYLSNSKIGRLGLATAATIAAIGASPANATVTFDYTPNLAGGCVFAGCAYQQPFSFSYDENFQAGSRSGIRLPVTVNFNGETDNDGDVFVESINSPISRVWIAVFGEYIFEGVVTPNLFIRLADNTLTPNPVAFNQDSNGATAVLLPVGPPRVGGVFTLVQPAVVTPAVPEPATWMMMILGMGAVGFAMRRSRKSKVNTTVSFA